MPKWRNKKCRNGGIVEQRRSTKRIDCNLEKINDTMRKSIPQLKKLRKSRNEVKSDSIFYNVYYGNKSLIWYRGYFNNNLTDTDISKILKLVDSDHIVVGHTSNEEVVQLYNNKIFGVDSSIKKGKYGEVLIINNKRFFRGTLNGKSIELVSK